MLNIIFCTSIITKSFRLENWRVLMTSTSIRELAHARRHKIIKINQKLLNTSTFLWNKLILYTSLRRSKDKVMLKKGVASGICPTYSTFDSRLQGIRNRIGISFLSWTLITYVTIVLPWIKWFQLVVLDYLPLVWYSTSLSLWEALTLFFFLIS